MRWLADKKIPRAICGAWRESGQPRQRRGDCSGVGAASAGRGGNIGASDGS